MSFKWKDIFHHWALDIPFAQSRCSHRCPYILRPTRRACFHLPLVEKAFPSLLTQTGYIKQTRLAYKKKAPYNKTSCYLATTWSCSAAAFPLCFTHLLVCLPHPTIAGTPGQGSWLTALRGGWAPWMAHAWFDFSVKQLMRQQEALALRCCIAQLSCPEDKPYLGCLPLAKHDQAWCRCEVCLRCARLSVLAMVSQSYCPFSDHLQIFLSILLRNLIASQIFLLPLSLEKKNSALLFLNSGNA